MPGLDHLTLLHGFQDEFLATIPRVDPAAPVTACAPWRVRELVVHLARVHHWAAGRARRKTETPLGRGPFDLVELYGTCAAELRATLGELDPGARAATLVGPGPVAFWHRRQLHETLVHLWDLRAADGLDASADPAVWADTVDEVVTMCEPRQVRAGRIPPLARGVALAADDDPGRWLLGAQQPVAPVVTANVTVTGPAKALALVLWHRLTPDEAGVTVTGERAVLDEVLATRITP
ncbi:MAG TPA: maleylpyruvate isomerase family mycothiol-dependent enzyme [Cellulomonas sp.]